MNNDVLIHVGVGHEDGPPGRGSGRYAWGTGSNPGQHQFDFLTEVSSLKKKGLKDGEIAKMLLGEKATSTNLRAEISIQTKKQRQANRARAIELLDKTNGNVSEVGRLMGKSESSIRSLLDPVKAERADKYQETAEMLKRIIDEKKIVDIGKDAQLYLNVPRHTFDVAVAMLEKDGYLKSWAMIPQATTKHETSVKVLAAPGVTHGDVQREKFNIQPIKTFTPDEGKTWWTPEFPESLDSKRVMIRYGDEGGKDKDGVIEIRRGVEDVSLGKSQYAQVRIAVDGTHYMKGMAVYGDEKEMPKGIDVIYNTNKKRGTPMIGEDKNHEVLKRMKVNQKTGEIDRDNPFGALIKSPKDKDGVITAGGQRKYIDKDGNERLSPINKLQDEGDWDSWSRTLSSQFLSKQPQKLIDQQINLSIADKKNELDKINSLTNPVIKKKMLEDFASNCDSNAASLSVKGFKNQTFQVILPITDMKDNEIYAPNYKDGDTVALVRYPHGGTFEIPVLKVNNRQSTAKKIMQNASDAVGINSKVAERLSGADFDGDTVVVIPIASNRLKITSTPPLAGLKDFDAKELYKLPDDAPEVKNKTKQREMGIVTNLITDMTVAGATPQEITRAVKHSMVVIDSEKHHLDYKQSEKDNRIRDLKKDYQSTAEKVGGASTVLSRAKSKIYINQRKEVTNTSIMTKEELERWNNGQKVYRDTNEHKKVQITDPSIMTNEERKLFDSGKKVYRESGELRQEKVYQMDVVDDARDLVRDRNNQKEMAYANYANTLKDLANQARKEARSIKPIPVSPSARDTYKKEVDDLNAKLRVAQLNNPRERQAQIIANSIYSAKFKDNPDMDYEHRQREKARALNEARAIVGAGKERIVITDKEWEAIQANAISTSKLTEILNNTDQDAFKKRATPKQTSTLSSSEIALMKAMLSSNMYTQKDIAERFGVSSSIISNAIRNL